MNCQQYDKEKFLSQFSQSDIFKKLSSEYKHLYSDTADLADANILNEISASKPSHRTELVEKSIFLYSIFYYLNFLTELDPKTIADIGCGATF
jgi:TRAP-type mannitol/chloroaromatic compound transport system substrate-binding protein